MSENYKKTFNELKDIESGEYEECVFERCDLEGIGLRECIFTNCTFNGCLMSNVRIINSKLTDCKFNNCKLIGIEWSKFDCQFGFSNIFTNCDMSYSVLVDIDILEIGRASCRERV